MKQHPDPADDPALESFCEWLYEHGVTPNTRSLQELKEIWFSGLAQFLNAKLKHRGLTAEEYRLISEMLFQAIDQLCTLTKKPRQEPRKPNTTYQMNTTTKPQAAHTPGDLIPKPGSAPMDWMRQGGCVNYYRFDTQGAEVDDEADACAQLYGAAPALLEALIVALDTIELADGSSYHVRGDACLTKESIENRDAAMAQARAAIAKATGQS